jgi:hypothetical protein
MKRPDAFFIVIVILFTTLVGIYYYSYQSLSYFDKNVDLLAKIERKKNLTHLAQKLKSIEIENKEKIFMQQRGVVRGVASVQSLTQPLTKSSSIQIDANTIRTSDAMAKEYYDKAKIICYEPGQEVECMNIIDMAITHFPESNWTGENLVLLIELFYRTKCLKPARDILEILKTNFNEVDSIESKVAVIERHLF